MVFYKVMVFYNECIFRLYIKYFFYFTENATTTTAYVASATSTALI